jgi:hypothetical protein
MTSALGVLAIRETWKAGAQCNGEAKVTLERIGPNGTFAGVRPDASGNTLVVAFAFHGTCWTTGSFYSLDGAVIEAKNLRKPLKTLHL